MRETETVPGSKYLTSANFKYLTSIKKSWQTFLDNLANAERRNSALPSIRTY